VRIGLYGGCGGRLQMSAGSEQLDILRYYSDCPPNQDAWYIQYDITVGKEGNVTFILEPAVISVSNPPSSACTRGCETEEDKR
jgi:hypothetical protein